MWWPQIGTNMLASWAKQCSQGGHLAALFSQDKAQERAWHSESQPPQHPGLTGPHALWAQRGPRRPAGQRQVPLTASQGVPAAQSQAPWQSNPKKPAGQAVGGGRGWGADLGHQAPPTHLPPRPGLPLPGSPSSQKVPLQPAGQVQAPLTWSQAAPCSHWHCCPQPGPKWPWGHPETHGPGPPSAGGSEPDPVLPRASAIPAVAGDRGEGTGSLPQGCWAQPQDSAPIPAQV